MKNKYLFISIFSLIISLNSCSKEDSQESSANKLSSKTWVIENKILSPSIIYNNIEISNMSLFETDETKNYVFKFNTDGTLIVNDSSNNIILNSTWELNSDETELTFGEPLLYPIPLVGDVGYSKIDIISITKSEIIGTVTMAFNEEIYVVTLNFI